VSWFRDLVKRQFPEATTKTIDDLVAKWTKQERVPCPACGNGTPTTHVFATGECGLCKHPMRPVVLKGGKAA
jgi:hypothetical protein